MLSTSIVLALLACGSPPPDPSSTPEGRLCGRAYGSTIDSLEDLYNQQGVDLPSFLSKEEYVAKCVGLGFTEAELKCLDPKIATGNKECEVALEKVKDKRAELSKALVKQGAAPAPAAEPAPAAP